MHDPRSSRRPTALSTPGDRSPKRGQAQNRAFMVGPVDLVLYPRSTGHISKLVLWTLDISVTGPTYIQVGPVDLGYKCQTGLLTSEPHTLLLTDMHNAHTDNVLCMAQITSSDPCKVGEAWSVRTMCAPHACARRRIICRSCRASRRHAARREKCSNRRELLARGGVGRAFSAVPPVQVARTTV